MSVSIRCPHCQATLKAAALPADQASLKCPKCKQAFRYQAPAATPPPLPSPVAVSVSTSPGSAPEPARERGRGWMVVVVVLLVCGGLGFGAVKWLLSKVPERQDDGQSQVAQGTGAQGPGGPGKQPADGGSGASSPDATTPGQAGDPESPTDPDQEDSDPVRSRESAKPGTLALPASLDSPELFSTFASTPDSRYLAATAQSSTTIFVWDLAQGKILHKLPFFVGDGLNLKIASDGQTLAAAAVIDRECTTKVFSLADGQELTSLVWRNDEIDPQALIPLAFSRDGKLCALTAADYGIVIWDLAANRELHRLSGHTALLSDFDFLPDGRGLVSASADQRDQGVRQWNFDSPATPRVIIPKQMTSRVRVDPSGDRLVTVALGQASIWKLSKSGPASLEKKLDSACEAIEFWPTPDQLALVGSELTLWDLKGRRESGKLVFPVSPGETVKEVQLSGDGQTVGLLTENGVLLVDRTAGTVRSSHLYDEVARQFVIDFDFTADGQTLVLSTLVDRTEVAAPGVPQVDPVDGATAPAVAETFPLVLLPATGRGAGGPVLTASRATLRHDSPVYSVQFSGTGEALATGLVPNPVDLDEPALATAIKNFDDVLDLKHAVDWKGASQIQRTALAMKLIMAEVPGILEPFAQRHHWGEVAAIWDVKAAKLKATLQQPPLVLADLERIAGPIGKSEAGKSLQWRTVLSPMNGAVAPSRFGYPLQQATLDQVFWLDRVMGFRGTTIPAGQNFDLDQPPATMTGWRVSPDGLTVAAVVSRDRSAPNHLMLMDIATRAVRLETDVAGNSGSQGQVCFSPDGATVAIITPGGGEGFAPNSLGELQVWDVATGRQPSPPVRIPIAEQVQYLEISEDGTWLAYVDKQVHAVDLIAGEERPLSLPDAAFGPVFSPDGRELACVTYTQVGPREETHVLFVDLETGQVRETIREVTTKVQQIAYSPDGRLLAVGGGEFDGRNYRSFDTHPGGYTYLSELKLFSVADGSLRATLGGHTNLVTSVAFSPDGRLLASGSWDKTVQVWDVPAD